MSVTKSLEWSYQPKIYNSLKLGRDIMAETRRVASSLRPWTIEYASTILSMLRLQKSYDLHY